MTGLYRTPEEASRAYADLTTKHSYEADDIDVMMSDETRKRHFGDITPGTEFSHGTKAAEGLGKGSAIGGGVGAALAALFAVGTSIAIPGLGLVVAGPIAAALAGAGAGGVTGGLMALSSARASRSSAPRSTSAASTKAAFCLAHAHATHDMPRSLSATSATTVVPTSAGKKRCGRRASTKPSRYRRARPCPQVDTTRQLATCSLVVRLRQLL